MSEQKNYDSFIESVVSKKPVDAKSFVRDVLESKKNETMAIYSESYVAELLGEGEEELTVTDENVEAVLEGMSDEDLAALAEELEALEKGDLSEEDLHEISKERVGQYALKALASKHKVHKTWVDSQGVANKAKHNHSRVQNAGPDHKYGETSAAHADRVHTLAKKHAKASKAVNDAYRTHQNRAVGLHRAGARLAK